MRWESGFVIIFAHQQKKCTMTTTQNYHIHLITSLRGGVYTLGLPKILALQHSPAQASGIYAEQHQWRSHLVLLDERERVHLVLQLDRAVCMYFCVYFMYVSDGLCAKHSSFLNVYVNPFNNLHFFYNNFLSYSRVRSPSPIMLRIHKLYQRSLVPSCLTHSHRKELLVNIETFLGPGKAIKP